MERVDFGAYASFTIAKDVNMKLITALEESNVEGVNFQVQSERQYLYPGIASHILGRLGSITAETAEYYTALGYPLDAKVGTSGCEEAFESWLRGQDGTMVIRYDKEGNMVEKYYDPEPKCGNDVYLTIDIDLQIAAEDGLAESIEEIQTSEAGAITVMDPNTGALLATASYPTYDLTKFNSEEYVQSLNLNGNNPWLNRALKGVYAPGSTYKVGAALAALEQGTIRDSSTFTCNHVFPHYDHPTCLGTHGATDVVGALRDSCNVFFYYLGDLMGVSSITDYTRRLGLGAKTGLELSDYSGSVAKQSANAGETVRAAIGQADHGYTPLQLSVYMSTVVNGGTRYQAHLLDSVRKYYTGDLIEQYETTVMETVEFSDETYALLREGMSQVITENSTVYRYFSDLPVAVGGKTGTAEVTGKVDYALFCGYAPLDKPEIVVSCVLEEGQHGYRAAYAAGKVMAKYFEKQTAASPDAP
jgi:penicillin-binding protein 2